MGWNKTKAGCAGFYTVLCIQTLCTPQVARNCALRPLWPL
jgi:hypothetical protein